MLFGLALWVRLRPVLCVTLRFLNNCKYWRDRVALAYLRLLLSGLLNHPHDDRQVTVEMPCYQCLDDFPDASFWLLDLMPRQVVENALEVFGNFRGQFDARHAQRASLRAEGRRAGVPARRASR